jgi:Uncharacterised protein family UPF0547
LTGFLGRDAQLFCALCTLIFLKNFVITFGIIMQKIVVTTYRGTQEEATAAYRKDAQKMQADGYVPTSQVWAAGSYGCGAFLIALLLCVVLIGVLVFIYMLLVKPAGTLTVTYSLSDVVDPEINCPRCAERIKAAAVACRFCGHNFSGAC